MKNHRKQQQITAFFGEIKGAFYNPSGLTVETICSWCYIQFLYNTVPLEGPNKPRQDPLPWQLGQYVTMHEQSVDSMQHTDDACSQMFV